ncbi:TIGR02678 family protein [Microbispora hainanensis]|uniref:TIGR02678 family protein n=1 Tax=Microbispora hainanensis TaxID=568844 RepID=A0A544YRR2_9ACTN|nr:TIGR02678 family protein [Microbispora hainanensis]TQS19471.1 TIGR02678 family protein [Microbispora hainanensis]
MIADEEAAQRRAALRALLAKPLLTAEHDADALALVRRHFTALREWLNRETGWRLTADTETARLFKTAPGTADTTYPARGRAKEPFGRRRYVALCLALAVLERADAQTTLGRLAEEVLNAAAEPELTATGFAFTLDSRAERADLVAVVRMLLDWGVLRKVAGDEDAYLSATGDVLYDVRRPVLAALLTGSRGPSTISASSFEERLGELTAEPVADTDDLRNQALRRRLTRRLLEDPVVYYRELSQDELAYLTSQRHAILRRIEEATGLVPEVRAEGVAMVDPEDELTDVRMPEQRTDGHVTLLVAEHLAGRERASLESLHAFVRQAAREHAVYWRKGVTGPGAEEELVEVALGKLAALRLVEVDDGPPGEVRALPAIARYALDAPRVRESRRRDSGEAVTV